MSNWAVNEYGVLTNSQMQNNATIIHSELSSGGWSINAISALLGNMEAESGINPGRWENDNVGNLSGGFGLVQWTPATKLFNWIDEAYVDGDIPDNEYTNGDNQLSRISYEVANRIQYYPTQAFPETFREWTVSTKPTGYLATAFLKNYERPADSGLRTQLKRIKLAEKWYTYLTGQQPEKWIPPLLVILLKDRRFF